MLLRTFCALSKNSTRRGFPILYQSRFVTMRPIGATSGGDAETFEQKNLRLNRPLSPHLTIYQPQLTMILSILHRITGVVATGYIVVIAATSSRFVSLEGVITAINSLNLSPTTLFLIKAVLALPISYHAANGIRHLIWDAGRGLTIKGVYTSGYIVVAGTLLYSLYLASL